MTHRFSGRRDRTRAQRTALAAAWALVVLAAGLLAVLITGVAEGVRGRGPLWLALLTAGVLVLGTRLFQLSNPDRAGRPAAASARHSAAPARQATGPARARPGSVTAEQARRERTAGRRSPRPRP